MFFKLKRSSWEGNTSITNGTKYQTNINQIPRNTRQDELQTNTSQESGNVRSQQVVSDGRPVIRDSVDNGSNYHVISSGRNYLHNRFLHDQLSTIGKCSIAEVFSSCTWFALLWFKLRCNIIKLASYGVCTIRNQQERSSTWVIAT